MKRFQALGLVDYGGQQVDLGGRVERAVEVAQRAGGPEHGGERRPEVVRDRREKRLPQPVRLGEELRPVEVLDELDALDGEPPLVAERVEQAPPLRGQDRTGRVGVDADDADRAPARVHGQEQALRAGAACQRCARRRGRCRSTIWRPRGRPSSSWSSGG